MTKASPILFSTPMIRAILEGRKTQTRRIMKPQTPSTAGRYCGWVIPEYRTDCPFGRSDDLLWVRETFGVVDGIPQYKAGSQFSNRPVITPLRYKPSIHMPRSASRITLEIKDIRVERLQDISELDAQAEGCFFTDYGRRCYHQGQKNISTCPAPQEHHPKKEGWMWDKTTSSDQCFLSAKTAFGGLWAKVNGSESWYENPWVWAITFKTHLINIDKFLQGKESK